jgi:hypothetical protein
MLVGMAEVKLGTGRAAAGPRPLGSWRREHRGPPDRLPRGDTNTARSAAGRAAPESVVFAPSMVLPGRGVSWRAKGEDVIVGRFDLPPERPGVWARIDG